MPVQFLTPKQIAQYGRYGVLGVKGRFPTLKGIKGFLHVPQ